MKNAIIHISDLHFVAEYEREDYIKYSQSFEITFFNNLEEELKKRTCKLKYIILSGDISNSGENREFEEALKFLNNLKDKFQIDRNNILICPGNHDINWNDLRNHIDNIPKQERIKLYEYHYEKFKNFKNFYSSFFKDTNKKEFNPKEAIIDIIKDDEDKLIIIGINSCYMESTIKEHHTGYIEEVSLKKAIDDLLKKEITNYNRIIVMHHNPKDFENESASIKNWNDINPILDNKFPSFFSGHIHSSNGIGEIKRDIRYYVSSGSLLKKGITNSFNLLYKSDDDNHKYKVDIIQYEDENPKDLYWQHHDNKDTIKEISLYIKVGEEALQENTSNKENSDLPFISVNNREENKELNTAKVIDSNRLVDELISVIQGKKLFKTGHFQWSKDFKSFGIIDINYLVSTQETLDLISKLFISRFKQIFETTMPDLILGVGFESNVIGARLSILYPKIVYSFIPDLYKNDGFSEFEHKIEEGNYKNIVLIKDILFNANSLKDLLSKDFIKDKNVFIFSLFYCGEQKETELFSNYSNVKHFSICDKIKINVCKISNINDCPIVKYKLDTCYSLFNNNSNESY